jgi:serine protease Do
MQMPRTSARRRWQLTAVAGLCALLAGLAVVQNPAAQSADSALRVPAIQGPVSFADVVSTVSPAVVNIAVDKVSRTSISGGPGGRSLGPEGMPFGEFFGRFFEGLPGQKNGRAMPYERRSQALGSGFIVAADGYIVTNNHVIADADAVLVVLESGDELEAEVVGVDARTDLALLKVSHDGDLPYVEFGDSDTARVGEWVLAIGNPFGFGGSATAGIISARSRDVNSGPYDDYLQIDAPINSGNSGGPVFNGAGQVIGINTAIISPNGGSIGIGLAIPAALAQPIVASLMDNGSVTRGWLGVQIQPLDDDLADALGADDGRGALVADVTASSPAAAAGIEAGDLIRSVDGELIEDARHLSRVIARSAPGRRVEIAVLRDGRERELRVMLGDLDAAAPVMSRTGRPEEPAEREFGGLSIDELTPEQSSRLGLPAGVDGVLVTRVAPGSAAADKGIRPGDVITGINQRTVDDVRDARAVLEAARSENGRALLIVRRGESQRYVALRLS